MKQLTTQQRHRVRTMRQENRRELMELCVTDKAREKFKRPPYGGKNNER